MIIRLALAYAAVLLAACVVPLTLAAVVFVKTWREMNTREDA